MTNELEQEEPNSSQMTYFDRKLMNEYECFTEESEETEVNELEQEIIELETELSEQYSYIAELEEELFKLNSQHMETQITYDEEVKTLDNKIKELEYDLFVEKTKDSEHKFYWFTAKRTPFVTDVFYVDKEQHLYGFKQVPNYHFIEKHDLRFKTHSSLDDLIEQL